MYVCIYIFHFINCTIVAVNKKDYELKGALHFVTVLMTVFLLSSLLIKSVKLPEQFVERNYFEITMLNNVVV